MVSKQIKAAHLHASSGRGKSKAQGDITLPLLGAKRKIPPADEKGD